MNKIKFNNSAEFVIDSYNRNTYIDVNGNVSSTANCALSTFVESFDEVAKAPITSLIITHDGDTIYSLSNINAHIDSINEYLNVDKVNININMSFKPVEEAEEESEEEPV